MSVRVMSYVWRLDLPPTEKLVLLAIADHANDDGKAYPGRTSLAKKTGVSERTTVNATNRLESWGLLRIDKAASEYGTNLYTVLRQAGKYAGATPLEADPWAGGGETASPPRVKAIQGGGETASPPGVKDVHPNHQEEPSAQPSVEPPPVDEPGPEDIRSLTGRGVYAHPLQQHARRKVATGLLNAYCAGLGHKPRGARSTKPFVDALMRLLEQEFPLDVLRTALDECGESPWELEATAHAVRGRQQRHQQAPDTSWWPTNQPDIDLATHQPDPEMAPRIAALLERGPRDDAS